MIGDIFEIGKEVVDCVLGMISTSQSKYLQHSTNYTFTTPAKFWSEDLK